MKRAPFFLSMPDFRAWLLGPMSPVFQTGDMHEPGAAAEKLLLFRASVRGRSFAVVLDGDLVYSDATDGKTFKDFLAD